MQLDIDRLIAYFGGVNALAEALKQHDPSGAASTAAIYKWRTRGSLPLSQLQKLTALAEAQGRPLDLNAFMQQPATLEKPTMSQNNRVIIFDTTMCKGVDFLETREITHFVRVEADEWAKALAVLDMEKPQ